MLLPQTAEYALRAMACLVPLAEGEGLRSADIAERSAVPSAYLQKILRKLVEAGLLTSQKGHGGGFRLARPPERIRFEDVLKAVEVDADPQGCAFGWERCDALRPCPLHPAWAELKERFHDWTSRTTLASVAEAPRPRPRAGRKP